MNRSSVLALVVAFSALEFVVFPSGAGAVTDTTRELAKTYVNFYIQQGEYGAAQKFLADHLKTDSRDAGGWNLLGLSFIRTRDYDKAVQAFYRASTFSEKGDPDRPVFLYHYADALAR